MLNKFANWLVPRLEAWCERTGRVYHIHGRDQNKAVYLVRYFLFRSPLFCIYIHRFMRSDNDRELHDHPFAFLGYVVKGAYEETRMFGNDFDYGPDLRLREDTWLETSRRTQGSFAYRPASTTHRVALDKEYELAEKADAPLTVIFRGPYTRDWGFWEKSPIPGSTIYYWTKWTTYLGLSEKDKAE